MRNRIVLALVGIVTLGLLGWMSHWVWGRAPEAQILAAQADFLSAVESRDWAEVKAFLTDDYADDFGHDRDSAVEDAEQFLGSFIFLTVTPEIVQVQAVKDVGMDVGMVRAKIRMEGNGLGASNLVVARVNDMQSPWFFHWHKKGPWPWDWKIVQIHNDELPRGEFTGQ